MTIKMRSNVETENTNVTQLTHPAHAHASGQDWLSIRPRGQTGPISSGVTRNSWAPAQISKWSPASLAKDPWAPFPF